MLYSNMLAASNGNHRHPVSAICASEQCCRRHPKACSTKLRLSDEDDSDSLSPHVTYMAFRGNDKVAREVGRSAFSLLRLSRRVSIHVLTDEPTMATQLEDAGLPSPPAVIQVVERTALLGHFAAFGLRRMSHHSGLGGYSKLLVPDLLPASINATVVLDADTLASDAQMRRIHSQHLSPFRKPSSSLDRIRIAQFVADVANIWNLRRTLLRKSGALLAAKRLSTGGACLHGERVNSGVVLMDLRRMRSDNWTGGMMRRVANLGKGNVPARRCGKMVRNGTLVAGDQELLSFGCLSATRRGACARLPDHQHQDRCDGMAGGRDAVVLHFNCKGQPPRDCPSSGPCTKLAREYATLFVRPAG